MLALLARLLGGAVSPLVDRLSALGASLARKLALFLVAAFCFLVALAGLTVAFDLWVTSMAGPIAGALAVAGVYLAIGLAAIALAMRSASPSSEAEAAPPPAAETAERAARAAQIDRFAAPLLGALQSLGLRREQLAVLAGATVAKRLRPLPLVGLAILAGFLAGRVWKGWDALVSTDLVATLLGVLGLSEAARNGAEDPAA